MYKRLVLITLLLPICTYTSASSLKDESTLNIISYTNTEGGLTHCFSCPQPDCPVLLTGTNYQDILDLAHKHMAGCNEARVEKLKSTMHIIALERAGLLNYIRPEEPN